jgi:hypothetical protein
MWGIKWRVVKVNGIALEQVRTGKKQKPSRWWNGWKENYYKKNYCEEKDRY